MRIFVFLMALAVCATFPSIASASSRFYASQNVVQAFQSQLPHIANDPSFTFCAAIAVSQYHVRYSILPWGTSNEGGQALFRYDSSKGWVLLSGGGGVWTVSSLVSDMGVPQAIAEQLVAGLPSSP